MPLVPAYPIPDISDIIWQETKQKGECYIQKKVARIIKPQDDKEVVAGQSPPKSDATSTAAASAEPLIVQADEYRIIYKNFVVGQSFTKAESEADFNWFIREFEKDELKTKDIKPLSTSDTPNADLTARLGRVLELYQSEAVHRLVNEKKVEEAKKIIEKNPAYLTVADSQGYNVLHYAAKHDLYEFIRFILTFAKPLSALKGEPIVNINTRDASRWTPLHWACFKFHFRTAEILIKEANALIQALTDKLYTPLHLLSRYESAEDDKYTELLQLMVDRGADVSACTIKGETALHQACLYGSPLAVKFLLANRAEVSALTSLGESPLHFAVRSKRANIVETLLARKVDASLSGRFGTAKDVATRLGATDILALFEAADATTDSKSARKRLVSEMASLKRTALHDAAIKGHKNLVVRLIKEDKASIDHRDQNRWTAMLYAASHGYLGILLVLTEAEADVHCVDQDGSGVLHFMSRNRCRSVDVADINTIIFRLTAQGLDINDGNIHGATALHEASVRGNMIMVQALIENGAKLDPMSKHGETPLIWASREGQIDVVTFLLSKNADKSIRGKWGTALDIARGAGNIDIVKTLLFTEEVEKRRSSVVDGLDAGGLRTKLPQVVTQAADAFTKYVTLPVKYGSSLLTRRNTLTTEKPPELDLDVDVADAVEEETEEQVLDISGMFGIFDPVLATFRGVVTFEYGKIKDKLMSMVVWQNFVGICSKEEYHFKVAFVDVVEVKLTKSIFSDARVQILIKDNLKIEIYKVDELQPLLKVLQFCWSQREIKVPILIEDQSITDMIGSIKYPKENEAMHSLFALEPSESIIHHHPCTHKTVGRLYVSAERVCFGKSPMVNISFKDVKAIKKVADKALIIETQMTDYAFTGFLKRDKAFNQLETLWKLTQSDGRFVLFTSAGHRTRDFTHRLIDSLRSEATSKDQIATLYMRWLAISGIHRSPEVPERGSLKSKNCDVVWLPQKNPLKPIREALLQMRKVVLIMLEYDAEFVEQAQLLIRSCRQGISHVVVVSYLMCDQQSPFAEALSSLETFIERCGLHFTFVHCNAAIMQLFHDEFINIKTDWRFCLPLLGTNRYAWVDLGDVAAVAANVLLSPAKDGPHDRKIYYISGPETLSCEEVADVFTQEVDKEVRFIPVGPDQFNAVLTEYTAHKTANTVSGPSSDPTSSSIARSTSADLPRQEIVATIPKVSKKAAQQAGLEGDAEWVQKQYALIFNELNHYDLHGIVSALAEDILKRPIHNFYDYVRDGIDHFKEKILVYFPSKQYESLVKQFQSMVQSADKTQEPRLRMDRAQLKKALGPHLNSDPLIERLFGLFDVDQEDEVHLAHYITKLSILVNGTELEQLTAAFTLFDKDADGKISREDLIDVCNCIYDVLVRVGINNRTSKALFFGPAVLNFPVDPNTRGYKDRLDLLDFIQIVQSNRVQIESLGRVQDEADVRAEEERGLRRNDTSHSKDHLLPPPGSTGEDEPSSKLSASAPVTPVSSPGPMSQPSVASAGRRPSVAGRRALITSVGDLVELEEMDKELSRQDSIVKAGKSSPGSYSDRGFKPGTTYTPGAYMDKPFIAWSQGSTQRQFRKGFLITPGHPSWELSIRIALGVSKAVLKQMKGGSRISSNLDEPISTPLSLDFEEESEEILLADKSDDWTFVDYAPSVFASIRNCHGISQLAYMQTIGFERILGNLLVGKMVSFEEVISTGRSGSFFLRSPDGKYLIKTLPAEEHQFLRRNLKEYHRHIRHYPSTLICRFLGLHRLKNTKAASQDIYFVVMANLFDNTSIDIHEQYDLKGSTVNRFVGEKLEIFNPAVAMKDLDFHRRIRIGPYMKALLLEQAEIDSLWMESLNICDYSLLVGIHYCPTTSKEPLSSKKDRSKFKVDFGGMKTATPSLDKSERTDDVVYFIGLIDVLTQYDLNKKGEHFFKSIVYNKNEISAIAPEPYRKRFMRYLASIID